MIIAPKAFNFDSIKKSYAKYNLTTRSFTCTYNDKEGVYVYRLEAARKRSGARGGYPTHVREWVFKNLYPAERELINQLPVEK